jgi:2,3-bisphosphoglycerate-independent phosphoglycerate mutase
MKSLVLVILDGWGLSPSEKNNATLVAKTPFLLRLLGSYPKITLSASGESVGLPYGEMGNSEVGHLNLGTGRVVLQDLPRIDKSISDGSFYRNDALLSAISYAQKQNSAIHLLGLVSAGGVHSHINHLFALLELLSFKKFKNVYIHMITDGRDTPPKESLKYLSKLENKIKEKGIGQIASVSGRYYAMDRDKRWNRVEKAYQVLVEGKGESAENPKQAIENAYKRGETDEFIKPTFITSSLHHFITSNDALIFFNFRADRAKQLSEALISPTFTGFKRNKILKNLFFVSFTSYGQEPTPLCKVAFFAEEIKEQIAAILETKGLAQLHLAETEKYPHVTYFFNGGVTKPFVKEDRVLIPSKKVATYDLEPEMSAKEITREAISRIPKYDFTVINFANPDMVGHTGNFKATVFALEIVDQCLAQLIPKIFESNKIAIITADHGNAEAMETPEHTINPVFFILVDPKMKVTDKMATKDDLIALASSSPVGILADVAPTILEIMEIEKPNSMTGMSLISQIK